MALVRTDVRARKAQNRPFTTPSGYGPSDLQSAYSLPSSTAGSGVTVAIVDAFDDPNAEADLQTYRAQYGLPVCDTANGCFEKVNQLGQQGNYPSPNAGWAVEESLDIDMVSAICPLCHIILVESNTNQGSDLYAAVDEAVALGAKYVSNSWGGVEYPGEQQDDQHFNHPGVVITVAGGDSGYGVNYPAASPYVTAVGGTTLTRDSSAARGWSETVWGNTSGGSGTGSGCSAYEPKPAWQHDSGCANRMTTDVSAVGNPATGVALYDSYGGVGGWNVVGGTSVATPIIASTYALTTTPAAGTNPASYPYADPSALNDITSGANGTCTPAYFCTAEPGYDGPTGLGTPNGVAAFKPASYGTVAGTVTAITNSQPLQGATVTVGSAAVTTNSSGQYSATVPVGSYTVTASDYGYASQSVTGVQVTQNATTTQNFALTVTPMITLSGTVRDGSGHHWPLYAAVSVSGAPAPVNTNPVTGRYSIKIPAQASYTVTAKAVNQGYQQMQQSVTVGSGNQTQNFTLPIDQTACDATGYGFAYAGATQSFDGTGTPSGWTVTTATGHGWEFDNPGSLPNNTGGSGNFAVADPGWFRTGENSQLTSPVTDLTADKSPVVQFSTYLYEGDAYQPASVDVDVSIDGGTTWSTVWSAPPNASLDLARETIPLPKAAGQSRVRVRFRYNTHGYEGAYYGTAWALDDVFLGNQTCSLIPGGLVEGKISDGNTGHTLNSATVASASDAAETAATGSGYYQLFMSPPGTQSLIATAPYYATVSRSVNVAANKVSMENFSLPAPRLTVAPTAVSATERLGSRTPATSKITLTNTGTAPATVQVTAAPGGFTLAGQQAAGRTALPAVSGARLQLIKGHYSLRREPAHGQAGSHAPVALAPAAPGVAGASWVTGADYPIAITGNAVATDPGTGDVYSAGGAIYNQSVTPAAYTYDPYRQAWKGLPHMPAGRQQAVAAFTGGKLYVIGGWNNPGNPRPQLQIYNPTTRAWSQGPEEPTALAGSAVAVLNGDIYVIGGCDANNCGLSTVQVFDPSSGVWSTTASYPEPISYAGCGTIVGKIVLRRRDHRHRPGHHPRVCV